MSRRSQRRVVPLILLTFGVGCSDYNFHGDKETEPGGQDSAVPVTDDPPDDTAPPEETGEPPEPDDVCEDKTIPGEALDLNEECYVEYTPGTFTPVVEWSKQTWSVDSGSNNIMMMPAVASPSLRRMTRFWRAES